MNEKQLTGNAKNRRQYEINDVLLSFYDMIDKEFHFFREGGRSNRFAKDRDGENGGAASEFSSTF